MSETVNPGGEETELLNAIARGDHEAFKTLYQREYKRIYRIALLVLNSREQADEIAQEVFVIIWERRSTLYRVRNIKAYLSILTRNIAIQNIKEVLKRQKFEALYALSARGNSNEFYQDFCKRLDEAVGMLPPVRKHVFELAKYKDMSYEEIALRLNISTNAVKNHIIKSLRFLRSYFRSAPSTVFFLILAEIRHL